MIIFFGPLADVKIFNGGTGYDVINPPTVKVNPPTVGIGTTALVQAVVRGSSQKLKLTHKTLISTEFFQ